MEFTKMHGAGNDFVIIDIRDTELEENKLPELARRLCDRRRGIGADGLMLTDRALDGGDFRLLFYNADGSMGEMCGNGARCIARFGYEHGLSGDTACIETTAGKVCGKRIDGALYRVRLNDPSVLEPYRKIEVSGVSYDCAYVELGSPGIPHAVVLLDSFDSIEENELRSLGRALRYHPSFPKGANVNFVKLTGESSVLARTFERGVEDFTLACGTGSGSVAAVLCERGLVSGRNVQVSMPGGELFITLEKDTAVHDIYLTGPTCVVCRGEITHEILEYVL